MCIPPHQKRKSARGLWHWISKKHCDTTECSLDSANGMRFMENQNGQKENSKLWKQKLFGEQEMYREVAVNEFKSTKRWIYKCPRNVWK